MQAMADVLDKPIGISSADMACAKGSAMYAAVACGLSKSIESAQQKLGDRLAKEFYPREAIAEHYDRKYREYLTLGTIAEERSNK